MRVPDVKRPLPPTAWFRAFDAAARHLSFTQAAEELGFTQSAVSQNVRALEQALGTPLFVRKHRALHLTEAGRLLVPDVAAAMTQLEKATARFRPQSARPTLTVATSVSVAQWLMAPRLRGFMADHPDVALQVSTTIWPDDFTHMTADVEIRFGSASVVGRGATLLTPSYLHAVATPDLADAFSIETIAQQRLIQSVGVTAGWDTVARDAGLAAPLTAALFVDTHGLATDLACAGAGIALSHCQITAPPIKDGRLVALPLPEIPADEGYYMALNPTRHDDLQQAFAHWICNDTKTVLHKG